MTMTPCKLFLAIALGLGQDVFTIRSPLACLREQILF